MKLDHTQAQSHLPAEGVYLAEVVGASESYAKNSGDAMFLVTLKDVETHKELCRDFLMMEGAGARLGYKKLYALGIPRDADEVVPHRDLIGRRVKVAIVHSEYQGEKRAAVDISADGSQAGYFPVENSGGGGDDDVPF